MSNAITRAIGSGYQAISKATDHLNADKLANRLVEGGYNLGANRVGGLVAAGVGLAGSIGATTVLWDKMSPYETLVHDLPQALAEQTGFSHQALEVFGKGLEATAETGLLLLTANFGLQSVDAAIDMLAKTKRRGLSLKDADPRPSRIALDDSRPA